jgi:hypothetical protein
MTLNLTLQHYATWIFLVMIANIFFSGWQLIRVIAWTFLWQLLTPERDWLIDGLMIGVGFWLTEILYAQFRFIK